MDSNARQILNSNHIDSNKKMPAMSGQKRLVRDKRSRSHYYPMRRCHFCVIFMSIHWRCKKGSDRFILVTIEA